MKKLTTETVIQQFILHHGNYFDYSLVEYINNDTKVKIKCPIHNIFEQTPTIHKRSKGCPHCLVEKKAKLETKPLSILKEEFVLVHGLKYNYNQVVYKNANTKIDILCNTCKIIFEQKPSCHLQGKGCPNCKTHYNHPISTYKDKTTTLYYIKVQNAYKIGLTMKSVKSRYSQDKNVDIKIINTWTFEDGAIAFKLEKEIIKANKQYKYSGSKLLSGGNTELFSIDIMDNILPLIEKNTPIN